MFRIKILLYEADERFQSPEAELQLALQQLGFVAEFADRSQQDLGLDPERIAEFVNATPCDAWIVFAASRGILRWFAKQPFPFLAVFGNFVNGHAGIGPSHQQALEACLGELIRLGHQNISMFARKERRGPVPGPVEQLLIQTLEKEEIPIKDDTLPEWEESLSGFRACLASLFERDPPSAIIFQEPELVMAAQQFFASQGLKIPENVSLFCCDYDPRFEWSVPTIAHSKWDYKEVVQRALAWARNVSSGKTDEEVTIMVAQFVPGGTIAPPPSDKWNRETTGKVW